MKKFNKVAIIGVGLIGGSMGLALKKRGLARLVVGVGRRRSSLKKAQRKGAIDWGTLSLENGVRGADLIILATPVLKIIDFGKRLSGLVAPGTIITDVGSTKAEVVRILERSLPKGVHFVGGHPMAGSEHRGVEFAQKDLFRGTLTFLTKTKNTNPAALRTVSFLWRTLGAKVEILSPARHDKIVANISHLVHIAACELVNSAKGDLRYASSGFADTTRIASSDPALWRDIILTNKREIVASLDRYIRTLQKTKKIIASGSAVKIKSELGKAKSLREKVR